jgi:hypothetical protein
MSASPPKTKGSIPVSSCLDKVHIYKKNSGIPLSFKQERSDLDSYLKKSYFKEASKAEYRNLGGEILYNGININFFLYTC